MARLTTQSQTAASGLDLTSDPVSMALTRARRLVNFQISRSGKVSSNVRLVDQLPQGAQGPIDGIGWYYQAALRNNPFSTDQFFHDLLLYASQGFLFAVLPSTDPLNVTASTPGFVGGGITGYVTEFGVFFVGKRVRFFSLSDEILMVQDGGLLMLRAYFSPTLGQGFFRAGIEPPTVSNLTLTTTGTGLTGTYGYKLTYADEHFRESSPTPVVNITLVNQGTHVVSNNIGTFTPPTSYGGSNIRYAYLYRNTLGAPDTFYPIARHTIPSINPATVTFGAGDFYANANAFDNAADALIIGSVLAPNIGQNDPPLPASIGVIHKNRVFLNDINDANTLQVSNQGSPVQFSVFSVLATDGGRFQIGTDQGNAITALVEFGSILAIFKRRGSYFLYGDNLSNFVVRPVHQRGCISPDSAYRCDNVVCFLSDDGVYAAAYEGGDVVTKISKEIEADLLQQSIEDRETSVGWFVDNRYHLAVGPIIYVYDFDASGWTCYVFGSGDIRLGSGIPDTTVQARVGFSPMGNSALYGSVVPGEADCGPSCSIRLSPTAIEVPKEGGTYQVDIVAVNDTRYGFLVSAAWIHVMGTVAGCGSWTVVVDANTACIERFGQILACGETVQIEQAPATTGCCDVSVTPTSVTFLPFPLLPTNPVALTVTLNNATIPSGFADAGWLHVSDYIPFDATHGTFYVTWDTPPLCEAISGNVMICDEVVPFVKQFAQTFTPSVINLDNHGHILVSSTEGGINFLEGVLTYEYLPVTVAGGWVTITHFPTYADPVIRMDVLDNRRTGFDPPQPARTLIIHACEATLTINQAGDP